jgi:hypothetical protein
LAARASRASRAARAVAEVGMACTKQGHRSGSCCCNWRVARLRSRLDMDLRGFAMHLHGVFIEYHGGSCMKMGVKEVFAWKSAPIQCTCDSDRTKTIYVDERDFFCSWRGEQGGLRCCQEFTWLFDKKNNHN